MNLFRVRGILLAVHFSFFLLLAVTAFQAWADDGWLGVWWNTALLIAFFACVVLHELGHSFTAMHYGIGVRRILLLPIGGMAEFESIPRQPRRELLITLAGPAVNFVIAGVLWAALPAQVISENVEVAIEGFTLVDFGHVLMQLNLAMGTFNLLPAFPMDGGRILRALLATRCNYLRATFWAATTGKIVCVIAALIVVWNTPAIPPTNAAMLMVLFAFIFLLGEMEYRAAKRREIDDAHMRATLARLYAPTQLTTMEPPLLAGTGVERPPVPYVVRAPSATVYEGRGS